MNEIILSIVIPMYKVETYIGRCLLSTQKQDIPFSKYEVICINDGSPDCSLERAEEIAARYKNIKVYSRKNGGLSAARNTGIDKSGGKYLFFLDSDDWIETNCLGKIVAKLESDKPDILCINLCKTDGINKWNESHFKDNRCKTGPEALLNGLNPMAQLSIVKRDFLDKHGLRFTEGIYHEDADLTPRMHYLAEKISFLEGLVYNYYENAQSITAVPNSKKSMDLINAVCVHLDEFSKYVKDEHKVIYHNMISMYINNALAYILENDKNSQRAFADNLFEKRYLLRHLSKSSKYKYRLEGFLFNMMPKHINACYKIININRY